MTNPFDFQATEAWRKTVWPTILARVDAEGAAAWIRRIHRYLSEPLGTGSSVPLSSAKPE